MPSPHTTLTVFAQVALGLAGFSGIVIALGGRAHGPLTPLEARRLFNLFAFSGLILVVSLLGMSLLHVESLDEGVLWRVGSGVLLVTGVGWMVYDWRRIRRLSQRQRSGIDPLVIYPFTAVAVLALLLQVANLALGRAWPFFVALVAQTAFVFQQFVLLVWSGLRTEPDDPSR